MCARAVVCVGALLIASPLLWRWRFARWPVSRHVINVLVLHRQELDFQEQNHIKFNQLFYTMTAPALATSPLIPRPGVPVDDADDDDNEDDDDGAAIAEPTQPTATASGGGGRPDGSTAGP